MKPHCMDKRQRKGEVTGGVLLGCVLVLGAMIALWTFSYPRPVAYGAGATQTASSTVIVGNATPSVTAVVLNNASSIILTANTTTNVNVNATISDNNGCGDITSAAASMTIMIYRTTIGSSSCIGTTNDNNCYRATAFTASSTCSGGTTNTTTTFAVQYFAEATDASATNSSTNWTATVVFKDANAASGTADSTAQELLSLAALNVTTSSINYGTLSASSTTGTVNQIATTTNAGNSTTTLRLSANSTLTKGSDSIATSNQRYSTSTFEYPGTTSTALTASPVTVTGFLLTKPTSTTNVDDPTFWGLQVDAGTPTGTYNGVTLFTSLFQS